LCIIKTNVNPHPIPFFQGKRRSEVSRKKAVPEGPAPKTDRKLKNLWKGNSGPAIRDGWDDQGQDHILANIVIDSSTPSIPRPEGTIEK
jgi:hypothetical protein